MLPACWIARILVIDAGWLRAREMWRVLAKEDRNVPVVIMLVVVIIAHTQSLAESVASLAAS